MAHINKFYCCLVLHECGTDGNHPLPRCSTCTGFAGQWTNLTASLEQQLQQTRLGVDIRPQWRQWPPTMQKVLVHRLFCKYFAFICGCGLGRRLFSSNLRGFMYLPGSILTNSGGFQVFCWARQLSCTILLQRCWFSVTNRQCMIYQLLGTS